MTAVAYYLLKVIICSGILFLYYQLALRNKLFHQWNRFYLLSAVLLSLLLPALQVVIWHHGDEPNESIKLILALQSTDNSLEELVVASPDTSNYQTLLSIAYLAVSSILAVSLLLAVTKILRLLKTNVVEPIGQIKFLNTEEPGTPFSFFHFLFWHKQIPLESESGRQIFQHELVHIKEKHTLDKLFMEAVLIVFWCNPFFWLIRREIRFIHEFIADQKSVGQHGTEKFAAMVLSASYPQQYSSIINPFFQTSIKRRLTMLTKIENPAWRYFSRIIALPLVAFTVLAFTVRTKALPGETSESSLSPSENSLTILDTVPFGKKEIKAVDVRTKEKQIKELEISYTDGTKEVFTEAEAIERKLISSKQKNDKNASEDLPSHQQWLKASAPKPIYIVAGKEITEEELTKVDPGTIESVNVLKDKPATDKYGDKGKNGVVEISIKPNKPAGKIIIKENGKTIGSGEVKIENTQGKEINIEGEVNLDYSIKNEKINEVVVEGYPIKSKTSENINVTGHVIDKKAKSNLEEVTVVGYPTKKTDSNVNDSRKPNPVKKPVSEQ